jgi:hypothetical protein
MTTDDSVKAENLEDVDARDIGERSDAVLRTAMHGHDGSITSL